MVHPATQDSRAFARRPIANRDSHSLAAATAAVLRAGSACCGCVEGFRPRCRAAVMASQDPNIIADGVRSRLVTVERTCRSLTASVGPFKDPHHVRSQIRTMVVELERAVIDGQRGYRGTKDSTLLVLSLGIGLCCCPGKRAERSDQLDHENAELKSLGALPVIGSGDLGAANPSISSRSL
jgi:hypothetical protein